MRFQLPDGKIVRIDTAFSYGGVRYPSNWLRLMSVADRIAFGAVELPEPETFDERWYYGPGNPKPIKLIKERKLSDLAAYRYNKEISGVGGFRTDRESQSLITGAALAATLDPNYTVDWKGTSSWITLTAPQLIAAAQGLRAHVQACFSNEKTHALAIEALTDFQAVVDYDITTGWPE